MWVINCMIKTTQILLALSLMMLVSCTENIKQVEFESFLSEPCMIVNSEQDNTIEGHYLIVKSISLNDSLITIDLPNNFYVNDSNFSNWVIGWGTNMPLFDAGVENIREISKIEKDNKIIRLGEISRGKGFPETGQRIVFWNKFPSGFRNRLNKPIIDPKMWPEFVGSSVSFSSVKFDSILMKWIMIVNECDTSKIQIYAAMSDDLINWKAANNGIPILRASDFKKCSWSGVDKYAKIEQTPLVSDIVRYNGKWFLFMDGYSFDGKRHIGIAVSKTTLIGPYTIIPKPVLSPGKKGDWNDESCFYAKIKKSRTGFIMFYDGRNAKGLERIGMATSMDLINWNNCNKNPVIDQHSGWSSSLGTSEPNYIEIRHDTILLMVAGAKTFKIGAWHHYVTRRMYLDKSGNVDDTQLGIYISTDGGRSFIPHKNNPVFTNNYANVYENEHLGGNFCFIKTDSIEYVFYQAKSSENGLKYNVMLRQRRAK